MGQQVLGGHGYIKDWGLEQIVRDARIGQIYEGTNGVQANDLVSRKIVRDGGVTMRNSSPKCVLRTCPQIMSKTFPNSANFCWT